MTLFPASDGSSDANPGAKGKLAMMEQLGLLILPDGSEVRQHPDKILEEKYLVCL